MRYLKNIVINFHAIYDSRWMEKILLFLKKTYNIISIEELYSYYQGEKELSNACHITFDDGDVSFYKIVFPLLKKHNISASIYVSPKATIERTNFWFQEKKDYDKILLKKIFCEVNNLSYEDVIEPINVLLKNSTLESIWKCLDCYREKTNTKLTSCMNMNLEQLKELDESGLVAIGAHTMDHPILFNESDERSYQEISDSIVELKKILNKEILYFAYPNGIPNVDFSRREMDTLEKMGIKMAFSTDPQFINKNDNLLSIPRTGLTKGNIPFIFTKLLLGPKYKMIKKLMKGKQENELRL